MDTIWIRSGYPDLEELLAASSPWLNALAVVRATWEDLGEGGPAAVLSQGT
jgi:hypothetical protein